MQFRKKPVVIEAVCWNGATIGLTDKPASDPTAKLWLPDWLPPAKIVGGLETNKVRPNEVFRVGDDLFIGTLEGTLHVSPGDWIIRGVEGEIYPCKPNIFSATYEAVMPLGALLAESGGDTLKRLGTDGMKWAQEFSLTADHLGYSRMDEGWLVAWFANAIEAGAARTEAIYLSRHGNPDCSGSYRT